MRKILFILACLLLIIIIGNLPLMRWIYGGGDCEYSNVNGAFTFVEMNFKGRDFARCKRKFLEFKKQKLGDTVLYRLCSKNALQFWNYGEYLFSAKYKLPYKPWEEINKTRGPIENKSGFQDF